MSYRVQIANLPPEILLRIYDHLFINQNVQIEDTLPGSTEGFVMKKVPMSAQFIRVCRQIYRETHVLLYANNTFNCSQREGLRLLLQSIGPKNSSLIKHVVLDWEQLQDFAWSLAKNDFKTATSGLETIDLATWRTRVTGGNSFVWREVKSYERQLCQSALDICEKHPNLKWVAQRPSPKPGRTINSMRVKWRFVRSETDLRPDEAIVPLLQELAQIRASGDSEAGGLGAQLMIDPF